MFRTLALSDQQISDFHKDGYVVVRGAYDAAEMQQIEATSGV